MIRKSDLVKAINDLSHDLVSLSIRVGNLEKKNREQNKKAQPRDKSGKFVKNK